MQRIYDGRQQRRVVILAIMTITVMGGLFFIAINSIRGLTALVIMQVVFVLYSLAMLPVIWRTEQIRFWATAYLVPWIVLMLVVLAMPQSVASAFIWIVLLPLALHFLLGWRAGLTLSLITLILAGAVAIWRFGWPGTPDQMVFASNFVVAGLTVTALGFVYDRGREQAEIELHRLAVTDFLTGLPNRKLLQATFRRLTALCQRQDSSLSMLIIDLDHFKSINDNHGHSAGDQVLMAFGQFLSQRLRDTDFACRTGGEEFLVLLPGADRQQATALAEEIRLRLETTPISHNGLRIPVTVSIGVAQWQLDGESLDEMMRVADQRMYECKRLGRNRVIAGPV
jgi:diguanylate cyclase (GGDEF)-like protein